MSSYSRIVVGSDGSTTARDAIAVAGEVAARLQAPVTAVTAWKPSIEVPGARDEMWAQRTSTGTDVDLHAKGVRDVVKVEVKGDPADALIDIASDVPDTLIVVGAHGLDKASSRLFGSTSNQLSHKSPADVLFVRKQGEVKSVALATDGSDTSIVAVERGYALASALGARATLLTVADGVTAGNTLLGEVEQKLTAAHPGAAVEQKVLVGNAAHSLSGETADFDLVVIGNRGMSGLQRMLGSTANKVTHEASTNLLLVNTTRN